MEILDLSQVLSRSSRLRCCIGSNGSAKALPVAVRLGVTHGGKAIWFGPMLVCSGNVFARVLRD